ncbi:MAG: TolC family protein, partial [Kofleriaceae bacterium]
MSGSSTLPRRAAGVAITSIAAVASIVALSGLRAEVAAQPITLEQALERAAARPLVGMASASVEAARGEAENAALPAYNPQLTGAVGPRFTGGGQRAVSWEVGLSQTFQLGGKRASRRAIAAAQVAGADAELAAAAVLARIEAWSAFQRALISRERVAMALEAEQVAIQVDAATKERQHVGFGTQLEVNLTTSEVGRARHVRLDAERRSAVAIAALASAIGAPGSAALEPTGRLEATGALAGSVEDLVARALRGRPEIRIARASSSLAQAEQRAADASAVPD